MQRIFGEGIIMFILDLERKNWKNKINFQKGVIFNCRKALKMNKYKKRTANTLFYTFIAFLSFYLKIIA